MIHATVGSWINELFDDLVYDPMREGFLKPIIAAEPYVEAAAPAAVKGFEYLADKRLAMQRIMYSALKYRTYEVRRWHTHGDTDPTFQDWALAATVVFLAVGTSGYFHPYTAIPAAMMDIRNLYNYYY